MLRFCLLVGVLESVSDLMPVFAATAIGLTSWHLFKSQAGQACNNPLGRSIHLEGGTLTDPERQQPALDNGRIVEQGRQPELLRMGSRGVKTPPRTFRSEKPATPSRRHTPPPCVWRIH